VVAGAVSQLVVSAALGVVALYRYRRLFILNVRSSNTSSQVTGSVERDEK
jgi:hypothetical protein